MTFWSNHGHLELHIGEVAFRNFLSGLEVLLCISIHIRIANNPGDYSRECLITADPPTFMVICGCEANETCNPGVYSRPDSATQQSWRH